MRRRQYDPYRGRGRGHIVLKALIVILLIVLILAITLVYMVDHGTVVSSDGYKVTLPFFNHEDTSEPPVEPSAELPAETGGTLPLIIESTTPDGTDEPTMPDQMHGVLLPRTALYDGTAGQQVSAAGASAAVFDMKADDGTLGYSSALALGVKKGVSAAPDINDSIRMLNSGELYTVARVSCFRDNKAPYYDNTAALRSNVGNWRDTANVRWLNPARPSATEYLTGVCVELAALGFDEILLDHAGYPTGGQLEAIRRNEDYNPENLEAPVSNFYKQIRTALSDYPDVKLSVVTSTGVLNGQSDNSGQTLPMLEQYADRVWVANLDGKESVPISSDTDLQVVQMTDMEYENVDNWVILNKSW